MLSCESWRRRTVSIADRCHFREAPQLEQLLEAYSNGICRLRIKRCLPRHPDQRDRRLSRPCRQSLSCLDGYYDSQNHGNCVTNHGLFAKVLLWCFFSGQRAHVAERI